MILTGRKISQGKSHGRILLCPNPVSFLGGVNPADGKVADASTNGQSAKDRVFAFPRGKGSTVGSYVIYDMKEHGTLPAAIINESAEPRLLLPVLLWHQCQWLILLTYLFSGKETNVLSMDHQGR